MSEPAMIIKIKMMGVIIFMANIANLLRIVSTGIAFENCFWN
jgi:hypothetical protein